MRRHRCADDGWRRSKGAQVACQEAEAEAGMQVAGQEAELPQEEDKDKGKGKEVVVR